VTDIGGPWPTIIATENTTDDLLQVVLSELLVHGEQTDPSKGQALEVFGARLELTNPCARLSRSEARGRIFSCLGELCWYLSGTRDAEHIKYYLSHYGDSEEAGMIYGGYGPRLFDYEGTDQIRYVCQRLRANKWSRRAVVQLFDHQDVVEEHKDVPCTCTLQFLVRHDRLQLIAYMRSNDAHLGLPHDIFAFTMLQELVARSIGVPLGSYIHSVGSLHLYNSDIDDAKALLNEGWQSRFQMPSMPNGDPWDNVADLLAVEHDLRSGISPADVSLSSSAYWADLERLLAVFALVKAREAAAVSVLRETFTNPTYDLFIADRLDRMR